MDAPVKPGFWPHKGQFCFLIKTPNEGLFQVTELIKDWPVTRYLIQSCLTGRVKTVFRHEVEPVPKENPGNIENLYAEMDMNNKTNPETEMDLPTELMDLLFTDNLWEEVEIIPDMQSPTEMDIVTEDGENEMAEELLDQREKWALKKFEDMQSPTEMDIVTEDGENEMTEKLLDLLDNSVKSENTNRATKWALKKFEDMQSPTEMDIVTEDGENEMAEELLDQREKWALKKFEDWQNKKGLRVDLMTVEQHELAGHLRQFYAEVRQADKKMFCPGTLRSIRAGINRAITSAPFNREINIMEGIIFQKCNNTLETMCKKWVGTGKTIHHAAIESGDLSKLENYFSKYKDDPETLIHTFWFLLCYFFARRGREGFRELKVNSFCIKTDDVAVGKEYLTENNPQASKNWQGGSSSKAWDYSDVRAYGITMGDSNINIVDVYKFLLNKLCPTNEALFQKPLKKWKVSGKWFGETVLGKNKLGNIMSNISSICKLSNTYTNHSVRATAITVMYQGGVDVQHICKLTKHKREESLKHYISGQSSAQKRTCSEVLATGIVGNESNKQLQSISGTTDIEINQQVPPVSNISKQTFVNENFSFPSLGNHVFNITGGTAAFIFIKAIK